MNINRSGREIEHNIDGKEFKDVASGGVLQYDIVQENGMTIIDIYHTYVPDTYRGQGIAKILCDVAFSYAKSEGYAVRPTCEYVALTYVPKCGNEENVTLV
jgi:predicted GNAT family acetyltransferase